MNRARSRGPRLPLETDGGCPLLLPPQAVTPSRRILARTMPYESSINGALSLQALYVSRWAKAGSHRGTDTLSSTGHSSCCGEDVAGRIRFWTEYIPENGPTPILFDDGT